MKLSTDDYKIYNKMEDVVAQAVQQVLSEDKDACGCPVCRADMQAMILNQLTPQYCPVLETGFKNEKLRLESLGLELFNKVVAESYRAIAKTKAEPRHDETRTFLHNSIEEIILCALQDILRQETRKLDYEELSRVMAKVLNDITPRYTTTHKGDVFSRTVEIDASYLAKVYSIIYSALAKVRSAQVT